MQDIIFLNHHLVKGTTVLFKNYAYDPYSGVTRFWFSKPNDSEIDAWHVFDNDPDPFITWTDFFKPCN